MPMNTTYLNAIAEAGADLVTHIGLVDDTATELTGGTYARQAVTWTAASNGDISPTGNLTFNVPAGASVAGWRGYSASSAGTDYGGAALTQEDFSAAGTYTLLASSTAIDHDAT